MATTTLQNAPLVRAPDGSAVRILSAGSRGSTAHFSLEAGETALAVAHRSVEEIWYVIAGEGEMWRRLDDREETTLLRSGVSLTIPVGCAFQFRCTGDTEALEIVAVTMPPWPGENEAYTVKGPWMPTFSPV